MNPENPSVRENVTPDEVRAFFSACGKEVVTFLGFSIAGYEEPKAVRDAIERRLDALDPRKTLINAGATPTGIGMVYEVAKARGFTTTGIVSMEAKREGVALSAHVDHAFYVDDKTWGGFIDGTERLSPTSEAMISASDGLIVIGGGSIARDEAIAARRAGKPIEIVPADMNHARAIAEAKRQGKPAPTAFRGAVGDGVAQTDE